MDTNNQTQDRLLNRKEAANILGLTEHTLAVWASTKRYDLPYVKIGRLVKYRYSDLLSFIDRNTEMQEGGAQ